MLNAVLILMLAVRSHNRCSSEFFRASWELLAAARYGNDDYEQAAFAIQDDQGHVRFERWPKGSSHMLHATFNGSIPARAFAVVHTHPNRLPLPSPEDCALAKALGMPVYVVTRTRISAAIGQGTETLVVGDWNPHRGRVR